MVVRRKGRGRSECPPGTKEYKLIDRSQMSGAKIESIICARNDKDAIEEYNRGSYPQSLWTRVK